MSEASGKITRIGTGVAGIDNVLKGGIPQGSQVLVIGDTGTGKTLLALTTAYTNAKSGNPIVYLAIDESKEFLIKDMKTVFPAFSDVDALVESGNFFIVQREIIIAIKSSDVIERFLVILENAIKAKGANLMFIDSLGMIRANLNDDRAFTKALALITDYLRGKGVTSIIVSETSSRSGGRVAGLYDEAMFDRIIKLGKRNEDGKVKHRATIVKMRYTDFKETPVQFEITPNGIASKEPQEGL